MTSDRRLSWRFRFVGETSGSFRDYYYEDAAFMREIAKIPGAYTLRDGRYYEWLIVFRATLDVTQAQRGGDPDANGPPNVP